MSKQIIERNGITVHNGINVIIFDGEQEAIDYVAELDGSSPGSWIREDASPTGAYVASLCQGYWRIIPAGPAA